MKTIECEDCGGEGMTMTMRCYGDIPHEVDEECKTCGGEGTVEVPVDEGDAELAVERPPNLVNYLWK
jgi:DnaJ-class molecular chaperone